MKKHGSCLEFKEERKRAILQAFKKMAGQSSQVDLLQICQSIAESPQPRFWVSEERAAKVVSVMLRHPDELAALRSPKQRMYAELYRRVMALRSENPDATVADLVREVVYKPAPEMYIQPKSVMYILYAHWHAQRQAKRMSQQLRINAEGVGYERG